MPECRSIIGMSKVTHTVTKHVSFIIFGEALVSFAMILQQSQKYSQHSLPSHIHTLCQVLFVLVSSTLRSWKMLKTAINRTAHYTNGSSKNENAFNAAVAKK